MRSLLLAALAALVALVAATPSATATRVDLVRVREPVLDGISAANVVLSRDGRTLYPLGGPHDRTHIAVVSRDPRTGRLSRPPAPDSCLRPWYVLARRCRVGHG